ncbi:hypothetical protein [Microtetraspora sp. NBRC 13810]|uniref:hypothetical protein n=1 Tax=Microtetraspora sp. NBRC 13810 TaxID=3030990 RepID=UPI00255252CE|nr:hypothetical protein [Microtetraspora sp. NBRC 13810]
MTTQDEGQGEGEIRERLREIDERLAVLRDELGERAFDDVKDSGDAGAEITRMEEQNALIEVLEAEKRRLLQR